MARDDREGTRKSQVIVFLVSQTFLSSHFIQEKELGPALEAAETWGHRVLHRCDLYVLRRHTSRRPPMGLWPPRIQIGKSSRSMSSNSGEAEG